MSNMEAIQQEFIRKQLSALKAALAAFKSGPVSAEQMRILKYFGGITNVNAGTIDLKAVSHKLGVPINDVNAFLDGDLDLTASSGNNHILHPGHERDGDGIRGTTIPSPYHHGRGFGTRVHMEKKGL